MSISSASLAHLDRLIDWFIPPQIAAEREQRQRARMFLISHLCGPLIGNVVPAALYVLDPTPGYEVAVMAISITGFWLFPFILRAVGHYNVLSFLSIQNLIFCILWSCYFTGGLTSPTLPWVLAIPLLAFFYLGPSPSLRLLVLGLFVANLAGFYFVYTLGHMPEIDVPLSALQGLGIVSTLGAAGYVAMMALYYAKILASGVELESEMRGHLATAAALRSATAEAERASAAKAEFLANVSHELRTPLNAVIGYSQILLEDANDDGDEASAKDLTRIHDAGQHLLRLVNEVLDLSKIEAGKMELVIEEFDVLRLAHEVADAHAAAAQANGNALSVKADERQVLMRGDQRKIYQALAQIVENAVKFTTDGRIVVEVETVAGPERGQVILRVRDTGIGMSAEDLSNLFENFSGAGDASGSKYGGTGLGLALSLRLSRLMEGDIAVQSEEGVGSCFSLKLPLQPTASEGWSPDDAETARPPELAAA